MYFFLESMRESPAWRSLQNGRGREGSDDPQLNKEGRTWRGRKCVFVSPPSSLEKKVLAALRSCDTTKRKYCARYSDNGEGNDSPT